MSFGLQARLRSMAAPMLGLALGAAFAPVAVLAQELSPGPSPEARRALQTLLAPDDASIRPAAAPKTAEPAAPKGASIGGPSPAGGAAAPNGRQGVTETPVRKVVEAQRGQSLDALIRQHSAQSPLRIEVLREVYRGLNPEAFAAGAGHRLLAGARVQVPTVEDQIRHAFGPDVGVSRRSSTESVTAAAHGAADMARRGWVRYP